MNNENVKISKWTRVKKAFLSHDSTNKCKSCQEQPEDEIQRNYKQLQKKLSLEFQGKISEWERLKQNSPNTSNPSTSGLLDETHDPIFMKKLEEWEKIKQQQQSATILKGSPRIQMTREYDLPPGFKKKLQEWRKIKKSSAKETSSQSKKKIGDFPRWKSLSGHRSEASQMIEYPQITDEFRKKLEEWKQIKANNGESSMKRLKEKTPSPKLSRKNSSGKLHKKQKDHDKEIHWFEKELTKIEKEKQRLERERQKFMEREEK